MKLIARAGVVGVIVAALSGCVFDTAPEGDDEAAVRLYKLVLALERGNPPPLCRWIAPDLDGRRAALYRLRATESFIAAAWSGAVRCIDEPAVLLRAGIIPVTDEEEIECTICDGTPLPAEVVIQMALQFGAQRLDF